MKKRKRTSSIVHRDNLPLLLHALFLLAVSIIIPLCEATTAPAATRTGCILDWPTTPTTEVDILITFKGGHLLTGDPDPMQTRRFLTERDYVIKARSLNAKTGIVRFALGLLPHRAGDSRDVGRLQTEPGQRDRPHPRCHNAFYCDISCLARQEIRFDWTAPWADGAACVEVRALVTLEYDDKHWLRASAFLCRVAAPGAQVRLFPAAPCCACGSANYLMRFHGAWEPPVEVAAAAATSEMEAEEAAEKEKEEQLQQQQLSWSELLGTTHDDTYALWELGGYPSGGVKKLCESGWSGTLEDEIKHFGASSVLTVIKARDLPVAPRGEQPLQQPPQRHQQRSAIFTVNATHHLVTFLSRPVPTPGWCVGLSMLDLCRPNCTWAESLTLQLRPWDAGTDTGRRFAAAAAVAAKAAGNGVGGEQRGRPKSPSDPRIGHLEGQPVAATVSLTRISPTGGCRGGDGGRL